MATGAAVGAAHLAASTSRRLRHPVLDVGDRVIDGVPSAIKELAIDLFGTSDKLALLVGIALLLAGYGAMLGVIAARRSRTLAVAGVALFGLAGSLAAAIGPAGLFGVLPSIVGAAAGSAALWLLTHPAPPGLDPHLAASRRSFLTRSIAFSTLVFGGVGLVLDRRFEIDSSVIELGTPGRSLPPTPTDVSFPDPGFEPFVTPNDTFYRIDTALTVPRVDPATWTLEIKGMLHRPLTLSYRDLVTRPLVESDITLTCVSNEVGGKLVGHARWLGVRLDELLAEAGVDPAADQIVGRSVDRYTCGFPVAALDGRDALIAIGMNGEPLPPEHGFPARLVVPGLYGYVSATKWLAEIELTTFEKFDHYWVERGWAPRAPIKTQSRIDTPAALSRIPAGRTVIGGVAWAQTVGVDAVEVRVDDGPWRLAELAAELSDTTWRQWRFVWDAAPGRHQLTCRATDRSGATQTSERVAPIPDGATGQHSIVVLVEG
jgi:DMSO/TMAO reductase YedYZ molybdopterin-dependent catalytic subunit